MNELNAANSTYLKQHSKNPVNWQIWSTKALQLAKETDKLIVLSIGYSACHWCHVMEKESFNDVEVAHFMNKNFVSIKVDKEERPDIDHVYMDFLLGTKGHGGWPLNCILLPDTQPIFAGTYFNKNDWLNLLKRFDRIYKESPQKIKNIVKEINDEIAYQESQYIKQNDFNLMIEWEHWKSYIDEQTGGLNYQQKFPIPCVWNFLITVNNQNPSEKWDACIHQTLKGITECGLYDHLEGGFFRYCIDREWKTPHFEKMTYDNAQIISLLAKYDEVKNTVNYLPIVEQTIQFLDKTFRVNGKLFAASMDADNNNGEGAYYIFSKEEIESNFTSAEKEELEEAFLMSKHMLLEGHWHLQYNKQHAPLSLDLLKTKLLKIRSKHSFPALDNKQICSWNCMMSIALIDAALSYGKKRWLNNAKALFSEILNHFVENNKCYRLVYPNQKIEGSLEDYAWLIAAMIKLGKVYKGDYYFQLATQWTDLAMGGFWDKQKNLFAFSNNSTLYKQKFEIEDSVVPSSNAVMAHNLYDLYLVSQNEGYINTVNGMMEEVAVKIRKSFPNYTHWMHLKSRIENFKKQYVLANVSFEEQCVLQKKKDLFDVVYLLESKSDLTLFKEKYVDEEKNIFICNHQLCLSPVRSIEEALTADL